VSAKVQRPRALLADADLTAVIVLGEPLARAGFSVNVSGAVGEARDQLEAADSDIAILDTALFKSDIYSLLRAIREQGLSIPILLLASGAAEVMPALDAGADDVIVRPFAVAELVARCRALVRRARAPRWAPGES
jgi:DNA-binding response OmpR family regulator